MSLALGYCVSVEAPEREVTLFATSSGTYDILPLSTFQFPAVCHGVSTFAITESPICTAVPPSVQATEIIHKSHLRTAQAVPEPPLAGKVLPEASYAPL